MSRISVAVYSVVNLLTRDEGQDLVEYGMVVALIAFGAITGMQYLSSGINLAFSQISFWNK